MSTDRVLMSLQCNDISLVRTHVTTKCIEYINNRINTLSFLISKLNTQSTKLLVSHTSYERVLYYSNAWLQKHKEVLDTHIEHTQTDIHYCTAQEKCYDMVAIHAIQLGVALFVKHVLCDPVHVDSVATVGEVVGLLLNINRIYIFCDIADPTNNRPRLGMYMICIEYIQSIIHDQTYHGKKLSRETHMRIHVCICIMDSIMNTCASKHTQCVSPEQQLAERDVDRFKFYTEYYHNLSTSLPISSNDLYK